MRAPTLGIHAAKEIKKLGVGRRRAEEKRQQESKINNLEQQSIGTSFQLALLQLSPTVCRVMRRKQQQQYLQQQ